MSNIPVKERITGLEIRTRNLSSVPIKSEYEKYMAAYKADPEKKKIETLQTDVSELKSELGDIKDLLLTLVQNQK